MRLRLTALLLLAASSAPALAGGYVTLGCEGWQQEFLVGTGRQFRGQGLELWPMLCLSTGKVSDYARVMNPEHFAQLQTLAAQQAADRVRLADWMADNPDLARMIVRPDMFGQVQDITFGDIRATVADAARPTEETILTSRFVYYVQPTCVGRLVPFDYYFETGAPCPACKGGKLELVETPNRAEWE